LQKPKGKSEAVNQDGLTTEQPKGKDHRHIQWSTRHCTKN